MRFNFISLIGISVALLTSCTATPTSTATETPSITATHIPTETSADLSWTAATEPARYHRLPAPIIPRSQSDQTAFLENEVGVQTGEYQVKHDGQYFLIIPPTGDAALSLTLPGGDALNLLGANPDLEMRKTATGE